MASVKTPPVTASPSRLVSYTRQNRGSAVLFLFALLVAIDLVRRGWPGNPEAVDRQRIVGYAGAAVAFMVLSTFAPRIAQLLLLFIIALAALNAAPAIAATIQSTTDRLSGTVTSTARRAAGGLPRVA